MTNRYQDDGFSGLGSRFAEVDPNEPASSVSFMFLLEGVEASY